MNEVKENSKSVQLSVYTSPQQEDGHTYHDFTYKAHQ